MVGILGPMGQRIHPSCQSVFWGKVSMSRSISSKADLLLLVLVMLLAGLPGPVAAQSDSAVTMTVQPLLGGHVKYGEWLPLRVTLVNEGGDLTTELRAEVANSGGQIVYAVAVPLPAAARKQVDLYVLPPTFAQSIPVRLVQGEEVLAEVQVAVTTHAQNECLVGVVAPDTDAFAALANVTLPNRGRTWLVPLVLDELPERAEALRSLDGLILTGVDTTALTPAQGEALAAWVELGGRLLVGGGAGAQRALTGLPADLQLVELGALSDLEALPELEDWAGESIRVSGPFAAAFPVDYQGWPLIGSAARPLLIQQALGDGWVGYLALDPTGSPFDAWGGTGEFWQKLLEPGSALPANVPVDIPRRMLESEQMNYALSNLPALDLPSIRWLGLLFGVYLVLIGPVNYLALRRLRRLDWAWVTIPLLTLIFSAGGFGLGYLLRGSDVIVNQISIVSLSRDGERAAARSYVGLFSPTREEYDVRVGDDALISPLTLDPSRWGGPVSNVSTLSVLQGDPAQLRGLGVNQWSMQSFQAETWLDTRAISIDADLSIDGERVRGTIRNDTGRPLRDVVLLSGRRFVRLGDLEVDQELDVSLPLQGGQTGAAFPWVLFESYFQGPSAPPREVILRQSILEAYFHTNWGLPALSSDLTLLAWSDLSPCAVDVPGVRANQMQTTLLVSELPLPIADGQVNLPPGLISGRVIEWQNEAGECGSGGQVYLGRGWATIEYRLPLELAHMQIAALTVFPTVDGGVFGNLPAVSLYDWSAEDWVEMGQLAVNQAHTIPNPSRFVNPVDGALRLRVQEGQGSCYFYDLGLEGTLSAH